MKVLVIGGTGNISAEVVTALRAAGHAVTVANRGGSTTPPGCDQVVVDTSDAEGYRAALAGVEAEAVLTFLAFTPEDIELDHAIFRGRIRHYLFISSATVYRKPHEILPLVEGGPLGNAFSPYARDKLAAEVRLRELQGADFPATVVRPSHTFGRRWIPSPLNGTDWTVAARILAGKPIVIHDDGQTLWTLTAAEDFAGGLVGLVGQEAAAGEAYHITSDEALTWNCIYDEIGRALGVAPKVVHLPSRALAARWAPAEAKLLGDKAHHGVFDNAKIKRAVPDFACRLSFREAIRRSVAWFREDPARQRIDPEQDALIDAWTQER